MISSLHQISNISVSNVSFKGDNTKANTQANLSPADKFLKETEFVTKQQEKGTIFSKLFGSPTAVFASCGGVLAYELYSLAKLKKLKKLGNENAINLFKTSFKKTLPWICLAGVALLAGLQYLFNLNSDKKYQALKDDFEKINKNTDAKLSDKLINSSYIGALCTSMNCNVVFNKNLMVDPIYSKKLKKLIRHELVHARQYETIARSEDGIKKLNFAVAKSTAKALANPLAKAEIEAIYNDVFSDKTGKYEGVKFRNIAGEFDLKDYIMAMHILLTDENATYDDIPIIIDAKHYEEVRNKKGPLTKDEEVMAEKYYNAQLEYPNVNFLSTYNPFSKYYDNLLEKEAYKESPTLITRIRHLFVKD